jgi:hypothetical protein
MAMTPRCPAAEMLAGPPLSGPSVICRVMKLEDARADSILGAMAGGTPLITDREDPSTLRGFCCGHGLPKVTEGQPARAHYTFCPVWEAAERVERERREAEEPIFPVQEKPKILGVDPEVAAGLLGMDVEEYEREQARFYAEHPEEVRSEGVEVETKTGVEAMEDIAADPEWKEPK